MQTSKHYDTSHGSPFDRGGADYWYHRPADPHYWPQGTGHGIKIGQGHMSKAEIAAYYAGFDQAADRGDQKDYG
jgi:hypothetical protein